MLTIMRKKPDNSNNYNEEQETVIIENSERDQYVFDVTWLKPESQ